MVKRVMEGLGIVAAPAQTPRELRREVERREFLRRLRPLRMAAVVAAAAATLPRDAQRPRA